MRPHQSNCIHRHWPSNHFQPTRAVFVLAVCSSLARFIFIHLVSSTTSCNRQSIPTTKRRCTSVFDTSIYNNFTTSYWLREFRPINPCKPPLTTGSNRSLRSLGRAKARPLTKRYALGEKMRWLILITSLVLSTNAMASEVCNTNRFDVCKKAREISDEMAKNLPMQLNKNLSIHKISAIHNMISITALLAYDKATLDAALKQSNISQKSMEEIMMNSAKDSICISTPETNAFIGLGGAVQYIYKFIDGTTYSTINIESC